jgi:Transposase IS66 family
MGLPPNVDALSLTDLKALVVALLGRIADLERTVAAQREEMARLKGLPLRPQIKPSGLDKATTPAQPRKSSRRLRRRRLRRRRAKSANLAVHEERRLRPTPLPPGSRFKGYATFLVQDLVLRPHVVRIRRERWLTPDGHTLMAPMPAEVVGHFGPGLRRFVLAQVHQGQVTLPRLLDQLASLGVIISKRQLVRLSTSGQDLFLDETRDVLRAGLETSRWISVDDTGARHKGKNVTCTQIGNDHFTWFGTSASKSRLNFLELLRAGHADYVVNAEALAYMRRRALPEHAIARLAEHPDTHFPDERTWASHLERLGFPDLKHSLDPVRIASEGAVWGSVRAHGFLPDTVVVSDDAGQFMVGQHALCWVHAERLVHQLDAFTDQERRAQQHVRGLIWWFYADLKAYCREPTRRQRRELRARFDRIFQRRTGFVMLDRLLARLHANRAELLLVLERPEIPLHTNGSERDIRAQVIRRKISGGTRSEAGRECRDAFLGLLKTCQKLGLSFWSYLGGRLGVAGEPLIPPLPELIRRRCVAA